MAKILIIDDSWLIRQTMTGFLKKHGFEYCIAENGIDGVALAEKEKPDCIILDLLMPDLSGFEVMEQIKEKKLSMPIIIQSADIQETTQKKCYDAGIADFIQKPPKEDVVIYKIKKAIKML